MVRGLISPAEQIAQDEKWIAGGLVTLEQAKLFLAGDNKEEAKRGLGMIGFNYQLMTQHAYVIGQIKWRLGLGSPVDDLERVVKLFARMLHDCRKYGVVPETYWAHLVAFVTVLLSGSVPAWVAECQTDLSTYLHRKKRLTPWEVNLGYQSALAIALHDGNLPECWPRLLIDSTDRSGMKQIHQNIETYGRLIQAARGRSWGDLVDAVAEADANYRKRGSSEKSYADVFGDGPYNSRSIDYITAAILRTVQGEEDFPRAKISTPHFWAWGDRDLSHISPTNEA